MRMLAAGPDVDIMPLASGLLCARFDTVPLASWLLFDTWLRFDTVPLESISWLPFDTVAMDTGDRMPWLRGAAACLPPACLLALFCPQLGRPRSISCRETASAPCWNCEWAQAWPSQVGQRCCGLSERLRSAGTANGLGLTEPNMLVSGVVAWVR